MIRNTAYIFIISLFISCAVQVPPNGGAKDKTSPTVEKMNPDNKTIHFRDKQITIKFNEFIVLNNPSDQIVISPPLEEKPEFTVNGKTLTITFFKPFNLNTTYTINFGNAVTDNHEGNVIENLRYVFSTGSDLDSNSISTSILNSFTRKPEKDISIGLYEVENFTDSTIYKKKPVYFTKSRENGFLTLENIPEKSFYLVAFNDENKNIKYTKNEAIAFIKDSVKPSDTALKAIHLWLFSPDAYPVNHLLDTFSREAGKFCFLIYKPINISIEPDKKVTFYTSTTEGKNDIDSIFLYSNELINDSIISFTINDPQGKYTVTLKPRKKAKIPSFILDIDTKVELNDSIIISTSTPISSIDTSRIIIKEDTIRIKPIFIPSPNKKNYTLSKYLSEQKRYSIECKDSAFKDIYGQYSKKKKADISMKSLKDYSSLKLNLELTKDGYSYIIQLISSDETTILKEFSITQSEEKLFEYLIPGNYKIKILKDLNRNGAWDNGDFFLKRQPEPVYYYTETINLKAYWDLEQTIDINKLLKD